MKKHPLLFNFILTMAIQIGVYLIYYPDILPRVGKNSIVNLPLIAEYLGYGTIMYSAICQAVFSFFYQLIPYTITRILLLRKDRKQCERTHWRKKQIQIR